MNIIRMSGGLGNQMFQYAFAKKVSILNNNDEITIDFFHAPFYSCFNSMSSNIARTPPQACQPARPMIK